MLGLNLVNRSFSGLLKPLDYSQGAPVGFLVLQKTVIRLAGSSDYILRLIPLLAGIASIGLMYFVSKKYSNGLAPFVAIGLFVFSSALIYYSSELKQYSSDVFIALGLLLFAQKCLEDKASTHAFIGLGIISALSIWISHPSIFVFMGVILTLFATFFIRKNSLRLRWTIEIGGVWLINLILVYLISLRYLETNTSLLNYWSSNFAPIPPWSNFNWYTNAFEGMLSDPAALPFNIITGLLLILGAFSLAFRKWQLLSILTLPFLFTLIASAFEKYPFSGRLLLFSIPLLYLLLAEGVERLRMLVGRVNVPFSLLICVPLCFYLVYTPIIGDYNNLQSPPMGEDIKPAMLYMSKNFLANDSIYLYYGALPAFRFYAPQFGFTGKDYILGSSNRNEPGKYLQELNALKGNPRTWFVFSHNCIWCSVNEEQFFVNYLNQIGHKKEEFIASGASVYLYDLTQGP